MKSPVVKRSVVIDGHKTSVSLEDPFWTDLKNIAHTQQVTLAELVTKIDGTREQSNVRFRGQSGHAFCTAYVRL